MDDLRAQIANLTEQLASLTDQNDALVGRSDSLSAQVAHLEQQNSTFADQYNHLQDQNAGLTERNDTLSALNNTLKQQLDDILQERLESPREAELADRNRALTEDLDSLKEHYESAQRQNAGIRKTVARLRSELKSRDEETQSVGETLQREIENCDRNVDTRLAEINDELRQMRERYEICIDEKVRVQQGYEECLGVSEVARRQVSEHLDTIEALNERLEETRRNHDARFDETSDALERCRAQNESYALEFQRVNDEAIELRDMKSRLLNVRETHLDQIHRLEMQVSELGVENERLSQSLSSDASVELRTQQFLADSRSTDNTIRALKDKIDRLRIQLSDREEETDKIVQDVNETCRQKIEQRVREMSEEMEAAAEESRIALANLQSIAERQCNALDANSDLYVPLKRLLVLCVDTIGGRPDITLAISQQPVIDADFILYILTLVREGVGRGEEIRAEDSKEIRAEDMIATEAQPTSIVTVQPATVQPTPVTSKKRVALLQSTPLAPKKRAAQAVPLPPLALVQAAPPPLTDIVRPNKRRALRGAGMRYLNKGDLGHALRLKPSEVEKTFAEIENDPAFIARRKELDALRLRNRKKYWKKQMKTGIYTGPLKPEDLADVSSPDEEVRQFSDLDEFVTNEGMEPEAVRRYEESMVVDRRIRAEQLARLRAEKRKERAKALLQSAQSAQTDDQSAQTKTDAKYSKSAALTTLNEERERRMGATEEESIIQTN